MLIISQPQILSNVMNLTKDIFSRTFLSHHLYAAFILLLQRYEPYFKTMFSTLRHYPHQRVTLDMTDAVPRHMPRQWKGYTDQARETIIRYTKYAAAWVFVCFVLFLLFCCFVCWLVCFY